MINPLDAWRDHQAELADILAHIPEGAYSAFYGMIQICAEKDIPILIMGNGGSAAVAEHLSCDWMKGVPGGPRVHSLVSNMSLITAIANDYGYEQIFSKQIEYTNHRKAFVIAISSSGNSENIVRGLQTAAAKNYLCGALVGFSGGRVVSDMLAAGMTLHVKSYDYGIVEDCHSIIMHAVASSMRANLSNE